MGTFKLFLRILIAGLVAGPSHGSVQPNRMEHIEIELIRDLVGSLKIRNTVIVSKSYMEYHKLKTFATAHPVAVTSAQGMKDIILTETSIPYGKTAFIINISEYIDQDFKTFYDLLPYGKKKLFAIKSFTLIIVINDDKYFTHLGLNALPLAVKLLVVKRIKSRNYMITEEFEMHWEHLKTDFGVWNPESRLSTLNSPFKGNGTFVGLTAHFLYNKVCLNDPSINTVCLHRALIRDVVRSIGYRFVEVDMYQLLHSNLLYVDIVQHFTVMAGNLTISASVKCLLRPTHIDWYIRIRKKGLDKTYFFKPFSQQIWVLITVSVILGGLAFAIIIDSSMRFFNEKKLDSLSSFFMAYDLIVGQGSEYKGLISFQILLILFGLLSVVLYNSYGGDLASFLAARYPEYPFSDVDGFLRNGQYVLLVQNETYFYNKIKQSQNDSPLNALKEFMEIYDNYEQALRKMCSPKHKYALAVSNLKSIGRRTPCGILKIKNSIADHMSGLIIGDPDTPSVHSNILNSKFLKLYESGAIHRIDHMNEKKMENHEELAPMEVAQMFGLAAFILCGSFIAVLLYFLEISIKFWKRSRIKKCTKKQ